MAPAVAPGQTTATETHPEELPQQDQPDQEYGPNNVNLSEQLINALKYAITEFTKQEEFVRRLEVLKDRKNRFYERSYQHVSADNGGIFVQWTPGSLVYVNGKQEQCPQYIDDYDIYGPSCRIIQAVLTQSAPGVEFLPVNPNVAEDIEAAQTAESYKLLYDRTTDSKSVQTQICRMFLLSGRTILWTRTEANKEKWGVNDQGQPKRMEITTVHGTLESRLPIFSKAQCDCLYAALFDDPDIHRAKYEYPKFADKIKEGMSGIGETEYERAARLGVLQGIRSFGQISSSYSHLVSRSNWWLRCQCFVGERFDDLLESPGEGDTGEDGGTLTVREKLNQLFPSGAHVVFAGDEYVGSWDESMDDALTIDFPYEGDGMSRRAIMDPAVTIQDRFNDSMNADGENWDTGYPSLWIHASQQEYDAINDQRAAPNAIRLLKNLPAGMNVSDLMHKEEGIEVPAAFFQHIELLQTLLQFILATPPVVFGVADQDNKTAAGQNQAKNQALGQLGLFFAVLQRMMANAAYQAALCASRNPDHSQEIVIPSRDGQNVTIRTERLSKGKFRCYPDEDSGFPETTPQKRASIAAIWAMGKDNPEAMAAFLQSPDNWQVLIKTMGWSELTIPEVRSREKQIFEIEELLKQSPLPPDPQKVALYPQIAAQAAAMGAPPPPPPEPQPTIPVGPLDYHEYEFEYCKEWLSGPECRKQLARRDDECKNGNGAGVSNVYFHALAHQALIPPPPMMAPPAAAAHKAPSEKPEAKPEAPPSAPDRLPAAALM